MKLWTSIYHAKYESDPSFSLAIIAFKNLTHNYNISKLLSFDLKAISLGVKEILDQICTMLFSTI